MKDFLNQLWVRIMAWAFIVIGAVVLLLGGTTVGDISGVVELVFGVIQAIGLLILAIGKLLQKKATTNK